MVLQKKKLNTKEGSNGGIEEPKNIRHIENKQQNGRSKALLSLTALNVNGLDLPMKRQRSAEWITKNPQYRSTRVQFRCKDTNKLKGQKKVYYTNSNPKKSGVIILISVSDKLIFKVKNSYKR